MAARELKVDRAVGVVDEPSRTYRFGRRNHEWRDLDASVDQRNKRSLDGYTRVFPDGRRRKFTYRPASSADLEQ